MAAEITVLHVDDDPEFRSLASAMLEREGVDVEAVPSARAGLDHLEAADVDCVVSDYAMPGRDGIEFLERVREEHPDLPFVLFTGEGSEEVAGEAIAAGATDYLKKGGGRDRFELLANRVENAVEQYRSARRAAELDRLRTLASDVTQELVRAEDRAAAERGVCEAIVGADPYRFAWIGVPEDGAVEPRTAAGAGGDYLSAVTVPTRGENPAATAVTEGRVATVEEIAADETMEDWREAALERGFESAAAVPLTHEETTHGLLVVYADAPRPFDEDERDLLAELGVDVAHAIHSFEVEDTLRRERDRREALFANAPTPVADSRPESERVHRITAVNDAFLDVFGFDREDLVGERVRDVLIPARGRDRYREFQRRSQAGEAITTEVERRTAAGTREFLLHIIPYGAEDGVPEGIYVWYTDVTEQKRREAELERQNERLEEFASVVSHDLRSPLNVAEGRLALAREDCESEHLADVATAHDRMETLIEDLLALARQGQRVRETETVSLPDAAAEAWRIVETERASLAVETDRTVEADPSRLQQLLQNLFANSVEHAGPEVAVTVGDLEDGFYVADDGPGIPEAERDGLFERGETGDGLSFGLSIVRTIAEAHGWAVDAAETSGGARFEITGVGG